MFSFSARSFNLWTKTFAFSLKTGTKSSIILKWKAEVSSFRLSFHKNVLSLIRSPFPNQSLSHWYINGFSKFEVLFSKSFSIYQDEIFEKNYITYLDNVFPEYVDKIAWAIFELEQTIVIKLFSQFNMRIVQT